MRRRSRLLLLAAATLFAALLIFFPARIAYHWFAPEPIAASGLSGTLWSGGAQAVSLNGLYVRDVKWRFRPQALLGAKLGYAIEAQLQPGFVDGNIALGFGQSLRATDLNASLSLGSLATVLSRPGIAGSVNLQLSELQFDGVIPVAAAGKIEVAELILPWVYRGSIGGYRAEIFTQQDGIAASIEDTDGSVDLAGSLTVLRDGGYSFLGQLAPKTGTPAALQQQLRFLGSPDERGQVELRIEGQL